MVRANPLRRGKKKRLSLRQKLGKTLLRKIFKFNKSKRSRMGGQTFRLGGKRRSTRRRRRPSRTRKKKRKTMKKSKSKRPRKRRRKRGGFTFDPQMKFGGFSRFGGAPKLTSTDKEIFTGIVQGGSEGGSTRLQRMKQLKPRRTPVPRVVGATRSASRRNVIMRPSLFQATRPKGGALGPAGGALIPTGGALAPAGSRRRRIPVSVKNILTPL